jgi:saccharopine dehydrogenase-like NADP-dependent oxidoreductase
MYFSDLRIITLGCGRIGSALVKDLVRSMPSVKIVVSDADLKAVERVLRDLEGVGIDAIQLDLSNYREIASIVKDFDLVIGLTPGRLGFQTMRACMEAGVNMVDLSYMPEDPLTLHSDALAKGVTIIPDCGLAPGLSNILVGRAVTLLDRIEDVIILVGGIPQRAILPLGYKVTWCVEDLIEEYVRRARVVKDGKVIEVEALNGLELIDFPGIGKLEAFYTDGVRTLHHSIKGVRNMWEKTLRYPGHAEKIRLLKELGFFDETKVEGSVVSPRELTIKVLERKLDLPEVRDIVVMRVIVNGFRGGSAASCMYTLIDRYDEGEGLTAMARTTAYTASIVVQLLSRGKIREKGVIPPEKLGMNEELFNEITGYLRKKGVSIEQGFS